MPLEEARRRNLKRFFTGQSCPRGHVAERYVSNRNCVECGKDRHKKWVEQNPEKQKSLNDKHRRLRNSCTKRWRHKNKNNPIYWAKKNERNIRRNAAKRMAVPSWYKSEKDLILAMYLKAKHITEKTGVDHQVDHVIPIQSEVVCGLHCFANLQILTAEENGRKSNTLP